PTVLTGTRALAKKRPTPGTTTTTSTTAPATTTTSSSSTTTSPTSTTPPSTTSTTTSNTTTTTTVPVSGATAGGYDISWAQCGFSYPRAPSFGVVDVSNGRPYNDNPCLASEYAWAAAAPRPPAFYVNTANPGSQSTHWTTPGPKTC